jgi:hypothetical protein
MALVYRNGRPRYQRSVRKGDRVTTEHVATGEPAVLIAMLDRCEREERDTERQDVQAGLDAEGAIESILDDYFGRVEDLARSAMYAAGFHRPKRQWRRRRD